MMFRSGVLASLLLSTAVAFSPTTTSKINPRTAAPTQSTTWLHATLPTPEESAKALSDYMARAHEVKLIAIKDAEAKKQAEIDALKKELEALKAGSTTGGAMVTANTSAAPTGSFEELQAKLSTYQSFIANYIVQSQEQKRIAVQQAEASVAKKYEEKLLLLGTAPASITTLASTTNDLYSSRNAKVSAAAAAGKSRWGDMEAQRASMVNVATAIVVPPEVIAADHGLRNDGGVGGLTLAERVAAGAKAGPSSSVVIPNKTFQMRNANVAAAGKASRWGPMEVQKAAGVAVTPITASTPSTATIGAPVLKSGGVVPTETITAADHGLRSDGGVGGLTLAERLASGAVTTLPTVTNERMNYQTRNIKVAAAGKASRWGPMEVEKAAGLAATPILASTPSTATLGVPVLATRKTVSPEIIEAADHGLRSDGGVGGLTLAERLANGAVVTRPTVTNERMNYQTRNIKVAAAGTASRWGSMEVEKAIKIASTPLVISAAPAAIASAGQNGGPTLAERVNLGAKLLGRS